MGPCQGHGSARGSAEKQVLLRPVSLVPDLLGQHAGARGKGLDAAHEGLRVPARSELVMAPFTGQQRPGAALAPSLKGPAVLSLAVAVVVVPPPAGAEGRVDLQNRIDDLERPDDVEVIGFPDAVPDQ